MERQTDRQLTVAIPLFVLNSYVHGAVILLTPKPHIRRAESEAQGFQQIPLVDA